MVTLALIQGVVNTFVIFLSRIVGQIVGGLLARGNDGRGAGYSIGYFISSAVAQVLFGILATMIVMYFSRQREFRADVGGADLAGKNNMIAALARLKAGHEESDLPDQLRAFGISGGKSGFGKLFLSHPPLDERIAALKSAQIG
jgi:heat shock protein HtpX